VETISEDDLRKEYAAHADRFRRPALIRVSQLLFRSRDAADGALKKLQAGTPWADVSRTLSEAPNSASGGSLGLVARGDLPADFEKVVWNLPAGRTTAVIGAPHGFHIFRVEERFEERDMPYEEAKPALHLALAEERSAKAAADLVAASRRRHPVSVIEEHLPFPYVGTNARLAGPRP
jgi:parvulin-like peptidyl-prolyl isomerase